MLSKDKLLLVETCQSVIHFKYGKDILREDIRGKKDNSHFFDKYSLSRKGESQFYR